MEIDTTRFGRISVDDDRIMTFPRGLLGFPDHGRYALIQTGEENYFFWLQCVDEPNLAFVVTDPSIFFKDYQRSEERRVGKECESRWWPYHQEKNVVAEQNTQPIAE